MLNQQTFEKLHALRLHGMAEAFRAQSDQTGIAERASDGVGGIEAAEAVNVIAGDGKVIARL